MECSSYDAPSMWHMYNEVLELDSIPTPSKLAFISLQVTAAGLTSASNHTFGHMPNAEGWKTVYDDKGYSEP